MIRKSEENKSNLLDIEVISHCINGEPPRPLRFKADLNDEIKVGKIVRVVDRIEEKYMGNPMYLYRCEAILDNIPTRLELKYERDTMKWYLYSPGTSQQKI